MWAPPLGCSGCVRAPSGSTSREAAERWPPPFDRPIRRDRAMTDADPETRDRLAGLVDHLTIDVESRLRSARQRPPRPSRQRVVAALVAFAVAAAAIGLAAYAFTHRTEPPRPAAPRGGAITVGSDYPECLNPITGCAAATATWWTVLDHVLPHAMVLDDRGNWVASPLLTEAPTLAN